MAVGNGGALLNGVPHPVDDKLADWLEAQRHAAARKQALALQKQLALAEAAGQWDDVLTHGEGSSLGRRQQKLVAALPGQHDLDD